MMKKYSRKEFKKKLNKVYCIDAIKGMKKIPDGIIDMILCDLPYGTTACKWDTIISFDKLWKEYKRIIKEQSVIVLTANEPFASLLRTSNLEMYKYDWIWDKVNRYTGYLIYKQRPLIRHEIILVFYKNKPIFNRQFRKGKPYETTKRTGGYGECWGDKKTKRKNTINKGQHNPCSILDIKADRGNDSLHPTQKPLELFEYLIKTYSNENDIILDCCIGSGTTAVAAKKLGRNFIGFDIEQKYINIAKNRLKKLPSIKNRLL